MPTPGTSRSAGPGQLGGHAHRDLRVLRRHRRRWRWARCFGILRLTPQRDVQTIVDEADDRAARLVLDALALPDDATLRARLRPVAAYVKALCREWLVRGMLDRDTVHADICHAVLEVTRPGT